MMADMWYVHSVSRGGGENRGALLCLKYAAIDGDRDHYKLNARTSADVGAGHSYQECEMAIGLHACAHGKGGRLRSGLQGAQVYLSFLRWSSLTIATGSSRSGSFASSPTMKTPLGQADTQSPQPSHLSVSMAMK